MFPDLPLEFVVYGVAVSLQASSQARTRWIDHVRETARIARGAENFALDVGVAVTLYYFPRGPMQGDIDNIVKPVLDALSPYIFLDDHQVERIVVQKFEPGGEFVFAAPSPALLLALAAIRPALYVCITDDVHGDLA